MVGSLDKEHTLLKQICQRPGNHSIVLNKLAIIPCESEEAAELLNIRWLRPGLHSGNLGWICGDSLCTDDMTQVVD